MSPVSSNFYGIATDFVDALNTLKQVLSFIDMANPSPPLRVVILNNTIVALTATIEEALRALFFEYLVFLEKGLSDYRTLPGALQRTNIECAIAQLRTFVREPGLGSSAILVTNLAKCLNGDAGYSLIKDRIAHNRANFRSQEITEVSKSIGLPQLWRQVCESELIENYIGESLLETRMTRLVAKWNELFDERNLVVHRLSQASGWGPDLIRQFIDLADLVVGRVAVCLSDNAIQVLTSAARPQGPIA
jgi:hypothetical protein